MRRSLRHSCRKCTQGTASAIQYQSPAAATAAANVTSRLTMQQTGPSAFDLARTSHDTSEALSYYCSNNIHTAQHGQQLHMHINYTSRQRASTHLTRNTSVRLLARHSPKSHAKAWCKESPEVAHTTPAVSRHAQTTMSKYIQLLQSCKCYSPSSSHQNNRSCNCSWQPSPMQVLYCCCHCASCCAASCHTCIHVCSCKLHHPPANQVLTT